MIMVFLTSIDILDTGFVSVTTRTSQVAAASRVNSGSALRLKGVDFEVESSGNLDSESFPGYYSAPEVASIGINVRNVKLTLYLNSKNTDTTNVWGVNDMSLISEILRIPETVGWKALYYPVDITATPDDRNMSSQLIYQIGSTDTVESQGDMDIALWTGAASVSSKDLTDVKYIPVYFKDCQITQEGDSSVLKITLNGVITG